MKCEILHSDSGINLLIAKVSGNLIVRIPGGETICSCRAGRMKKKCKHATYLEGIE